MRTHPVLSLVLALPLGAQPQLERPIPYPLPRDAAWAAAVEAGTRTDHGSPGAAYWTNRAHYRLRASLDPATAQVRGEAEITYQNRSPHPIRTLVVHLRQNAHKEGALRNRYLEVTGGVQVEDVRVGGQEVRDGAARGARVERGDASMRTRGTLMSIRLAEPLPPGGETQLSMRWQYRVPRRGAPRNGHDDHHTYYLGYWYPQLAVFEDVADDWVAEQYFSNAEFYMGYGSYDVEFSVPAGWLVRATGTLQNADDVLTETALERLAQARAGRDIVRVIDEDDLENGRVTRMDRGDTLTWHFKAEDVRDCAVSISNRYVWDATHAVVEAGADGTAPRKAMIHAVYRLDSDSFAKAAEYGRHTIEYMSKLLTPYPWPHMTVCGGVIGGGMEFPMMTICGSGSAGLVAHELIHMWFPMLVGTNEKARAWQDEGFTSFFTTLCTAALRERPESASGALRGYLRGAARGEAAPLMRHGDRYPNRGVYGFASYSKSAAVLHQLRDLVGDDVFFAVFRRYVEEWTHKHPYPADFFNAFSHGAGRDLSWYFRTWYYETWQLDQAIESVEQSGDATVVRVADMRRATYPTIVEARFADGRVETAEIAVEHWLSGKRTAEVRFGPGVERVELNPDRATLDLSAENNAWPRE